MRYRFHPAIFLFTLILPACRTSSTENTSQQAWRHFQDSGISLSYPADAFASVKLITLPKKIASPEEIPFDVGPKRWALQLESTHPPIHPPQARYYFPSPNTIYITPLFDRSVPAFSLTYSEWARNAEDLRLLLSEPRDFGPWIDSHWTRHIPQELPDLPSAPFNNAARMIKAKFRLLASPHIRGFRLLTYYANGKTGYGATNAELTYDFQGITPDGQFYVCARIGIRHPSLPDSMDDPRSHSDGTQQEDIAEQNRVNEWADSSFTPSLALLDKILDSLRISVP